MNSLEILKFLGELGVLYRKRTLPLAFDYVEDMLHNERIIEIRENGLPYAMIFYSVTNDPYSFLKKGEFEFKEHDPYASTVYIEKMISREWTKELRKQFESFLVERYPQLEYGIWHRYSKWGDRQVTVKRRFQHV